MMQYKEGDKVKIISKERFDKMRAKGIHLQWWNLTGMEYLFGTEQPILRIETKLNDTYYVIPNDQSDKNSMGPEWQIFDDAVEGMAGPMDTDMINAGKKKKITDYYHIDHVSEVNEVLLVHTEGLSNTHPISYSEYILRVERGDKFVWGQAMMPDKLKNFTSGKLIHVTKPVVFKGRAELTKVLQGPGPNIIEAVNHPAYYGGKDNPYEVAKVIEAWELDWHLGSAIKYIGRAGKKDPAKLIEDLEKAIWYVHRKIELLRAADQQKTS